MNTVNTFLRGQASVVSSGQGVAPGRAARANMAETDPSPRVQAASVSRSAPAQEDLSKAVEQIRATFASLVVICRCRLMILWIGMSPGWWIPVPVKWCVQFRPKRCLMLLE